MYRQSFYGDNLQEQERSIRNKVANIIGEIHSQETSDSFEVSGASNYSQQRGL